MKAENCILDPDTPSLNHNYPIDFLKNFLYLVKIRIQKIFDPIAMYKPSERDFKKAKKLIQSNQLDYEAATTCIRIVKAFIYDEEVSSQCISKFQDIQYDHKTN